MAEIINYLLDCKRHLKVLRRSEWDENIVSWKKAVELIDSISFNIRSDYPLTDHDLGYLWDLRSLMYIVQPGGPAWIEANSYLARGFMHTGHYTNARIFGTLTHETQLKADLKSLPPYRSKNPFDVALDLATGVDHPEPLPYPNARRLEWFAEGLAEPHQGELLAILLFGLEGYSAEDALRELIESTYAYEYIEPPEFPYTQEDHIVSAITFALADKFQTFDHLTERHRRVIGSALTLLGK